MANIKTLYSGANVLVTGATGFVGLCLVEKLLRCIPELNTIYVLIRPKLEKTVKMRLEDMLEDDIFNTLREQKGVEQFRKIVPISGDISKENLDLNTSDEQKLKSHVNFIFHCAANLDFKENLRNALNTNSIGTRRLVELAKQMINLKAFVHVSSAYVNCNRREVKELLYPSTLATDRILSLLGSIDEVKLKKVLPIILNGHPNFYTFSKALAEIEINLTNDLFPTAIVRPSIITSSWKEPVPGWTNSKNGPQGFLMVAAKGILRRLPVDKRLVQDYIPVDIVVNEIISSAWYVVMQWPSKMFIFHCTTSTCKPFKWSLIEEEIPQILHRYPLKNAIWYPTLKLVPTMTMFRMSAFLFHVIPAYMLDFFTILCGKRPMLVKLHNNINRSLEQLTPFIFKEWKFYNTNTIMLHDSLSSTDRETFGVNVRALEWKSYFINLALGVRRYLNNEKITTIHIAKRRHTILWLLNICIEIFLVQGICFLFCLSTGMSLLTSCLWIIPSVMLLLNVF